MLLRGEWYVIDWSKNAMSLRELRLCYYTMLLYRSKNTMSLYYVIKGESIYYVII